MMTIGVSKLRGANAHYVPIYFSLLKHNRTYRTFPRGFPTSVTYQHPIYIEVSNWLRAFISICTFIPTFNLEFSGFVAY